LIERFLPLARKLAARYVRTAEPYDDLVQVASVGLVNAVDRFDPQRGYAFTSFAVPTIVGELKRHFRDHGWALHVARGARERAQAVAEAEAAIRADTGRAPSVHEIAQYLEMSTEDVVDGLQTVVAREAVSLDAPVPLDDSSASVSRGDSLGDLDGRLHQVDERLTVLAAAGRLPKREREVLYLRFGADLTQSEIADRVGISQMQVSRLLRRSLGRLREQLTVERRHS
jgi:RNA polymerase sigma-B factor